MPDIEVVVEAKDILGEGVIWNPVERALYWCDNLKSNIQRHDPASGKHSVWDMPEEVGCIVFREQGGICAAMKSGFAFIDDLDSLKIEYIIDPEPGMDGNRLNDGKCDRAGRFWCGSMDAGLRDPTAALYRLDPDLTCHKLDEGIICSNGIAWSPDNETMYFSDTRSEALYAYDFDIATGAVANRRVFLDTTDKPFRIDGATVDRDGYYWCAEVHGWSIGKYATDGTQVDRIRLPVRQPTMCSFGGENLDVLYVTSATRFLEPGEAEQQPLAGALFAIHGTGAVGLPEPFFKG
jgi:sugar lactone lactonase YvrE